MSNAIVALISIAMILSSIALTAQGSFKSASILSDSWTQMQERTNDLARTSISITNTQRTSSSQVNVTVRNSGETSLLNFSDWDVIVQYYDKSGVYHEEWLPYTSSSTPGNNQWTVEGIYLNSATSQPEVYQPGILDPGEYMSVEIILSPSPSSNTGLVVVSTPNGITTSSNF